MPRSWSGETKDVVFTCLILSVCSIVLSHATLDGSDHRTTLQPLLQASILQREKFSSSSNFNKKLRSQFLLSRKTETGRQGKEKNLFNSEEEEIERQRQNIALENSLGKPSLYSNSVLNISHYSSRPSSIFSSRDFSENDIISSERSTLHHPITKRNVYPGSAHYSQWELRKGRRARNSPSAGEGEIYNRIYRHGSPARLTRSNISVRESDIAAIFRGVAYGPPTEAAVMHSAMEHQQKWKKNRKKEPLETLQEKMQVRTSWGKVLDETTTLLTSSTTEPTSEYLTQEEGTSETNRGHLGERKPSETHTEIIQEMFQEKSSTTFISPHVFNFPGFAFPTTIRLLIPPRVNGTHDYLLVRTQSNTADIDAQSESFDTSTSTFEPYFEGDRHLKVKNSDTHQITENLERDVYFQHTENPTYTAPVANSMDLLNESDYQHMNDSQSLQEWLFDYISIPFSWKEIKDYIDNNLELIWQTYVYSVAFLFGLISLVSLHRLLCRCCKPLPCFLHFSFYIVMFVSSFAKASLVLWNPYGQNTMLPELIQKVLYVAGEPCVGVVMSSFIVLLLNLLYGMIVLPVIIAFLSAAEMATGLFAELAVKYFPSYLGHLNEIFLGRVSFTVGTAWNALICLSYVVLLNRRNFRQSARRRRRRKDLELGGSNDENAVEFRGNGSHEILLPYNSYRITSYCATATFAQLFMISLSVYTLLNPHELLIRPTELKEKWMFFQILARLLEFFVYAFLLISAGKLSRESPDDCNKQDKTRRKRCCCCCCYCCCCGTKVNNDIENNAHTPRKAKKRENRRKCPVDVYTLNSHRDADHTVATEDFQLVWNKTSNGGSAVNRETKYCESAAEETERDSNKMKDDKNNRKVKKLKSVKERNEIYQSLQEAKKQRNDDTDIGLPSPKSKTNRFHPPKNASGNQISSLEIVDIHTNKSQPKHESIRGKFDIQKILDAKLPEVDRSMFKYMGVTPPTIINMEKRFQQPKSAPFSQKSPLEEKFPCKENQTTIEPTNKVAPKNLNQFWSPQHKPQKMLTSLPPLPLKAPLDLPADVPPPPRLNFLVDQRISSRPVPPSNLPNLPRLVCSGKQLSGSQQDLTSNTKSMGTACLYTPSREFIRDFMSSRPSPFSERFSSADLTTITSWSEMRVDYLTDLSSADGHSLGSTSYSRASRMSVSNISDQLNYYWNGPRIKANWTAYGEKKLG